MRDCIRVKFAQTAGVQISCVGHLSASLHETQNKECVSIVRKRTARGLGIVERRA